MDRKYTAIDMRLAAEDLTIEGLNWMANRGSLADAAEMLRQAADMMDAKKKYEYAEMYSNGDIAHEKGDSIDDVNHFLSEGSIIVRREVGEWEEVTDEK